MSGPGLNKSPYRSQYRRDMDSRTIVGSSPLATPSGGYDLTADNFPCLLEAFLSSGVIGNNLTGVLGTVVVTSSTGWTIPSAGQYRRVSGGTVTTSGTWAAIGNRHALIIAIGSLNAAASNLLRFGEAPGSGSSMAYNNAATNYTISLSVGNSAALPATNLSGNIVAGATLLDQTTANGHAYAYHYDGTSSEGPIVETVLTGDISTNWPAFTVGATGASFATNASSYYTGTFLLALNNRPTDQLIADALVWMSQAGHEGKLYPGFYKQT